MLLHLIYFSGISMFFALFRLSVSEARPLSVSVALGLSIRFTGTSSILKRISDSFSGMVNAGEVLLHVVRISFVFQTSKMPKTVQKKEVIISEKEEEKIAIEYIPI